MGLDMIARLDARLKNKQGAGPSLRADRLGGAPPLIPRSGALTSFGASGGEFIGRSGSAAADGGRTSPSFDESAASFRDDEGELDDYERGVRATALELAIASAAAAAVVPRAFTTLSDVGRAHAATPIDSAFDTPQLEASLAFTLRLPAAETTAGAFRERYATAIRHAFTFNPAAADAVKSTLHKSTVNALTCAMLVPELRAVFAGCEDG